MKVLAWLFAIFIGLAILIVIVASPPHSTTLETRTNQNTDTGNSANTNSSDKVAVESAQKPSKPVHDCVTTELSQTYVEEEVRLAFGEGDTYLHYCFVSGYQGIDCGDDLEITRAVGHGLSNRERAKCDAIMRRFERLHAAEEARKKRLDEAYDKQHHLKPAN